MVVGLTEKTYIDAATTKIERVPRVLLTNTKFQCRDNKWQKQIVRGGNTFLKGKEPTLDDTACRYGNLEERPAS